MKILVAVKKVIGSEVPIRLSADESGIDQSQVKMSMNPFDEIALEEAIRLKEKSHASEIIVFTIGPASHQDILRHGLSLGADRALHALTDVNVTPLQVAKIIQHVVNKDADIRMVLLGKQAIDSDDNQVGQMLAALLNWSQGTFISAIEMHAEHLIVKREIDEGLETLKLSLPAVCTADLRLNTPRYASLPNIMKAKAKPYEQFNAADCLDLNQHDLEITRLKTSRRPRKKILLNSFEDFFAKVKEEVNAS